jgi:predicted branched-subunit amino acid permease
MIGATVLQGVGWISGTAIGAVGGDFIGNPERLGLDVIFPAFFLVLLVEELRRSHRAVAVALIAAALALVLVPFAPPGVPVIAACIAALFGLRRP